MGLIKGISALLFAVLVTQAANAADMAVRATNLFNSGLPAWVVTDQRADTDAFVSRGFSSARFSGASAFWHFQLDLGDHIALPHALFFGLSAAVTEPVPFTSCVGSCGQSQQVQGWLGFKIDSASIYASGWLSPSIDNSSLAIPQSSFSKWSIGGGINFELVSGISVSLDYQRIEAFACTNGCAHNLGLIFPATENRITAGIVISASSTDTTRPQPTAPTTTPTPTPTPALAPRTWRTPLK
jgi:hypothetical protein